ncbi:putative leucine rich repeat protein [Toxoplasma gondii TgCatPRC2]|uniref:Dynein axonemal assembly factor 11-like CS domain-containing protein n=3 Tax=Toxoplasma gondii TaxID=5811 RepID=S8F4V5_TOXGM|nr:hypothetical protein TGME49_239120 [Toxoplasma gondii ME49]EPT30806.1 hypothetical protein TGME49_239120 [Toxoplasma gondii ME49]ESS31312.1 putative leucine rich repeat protein [Toxoplasma gondii VEG]KYK66228.1 putative leucine rich repeat protein [Toxoplasma gondii TgCatPRC2]CEL73293.1 TPA: hypothetical protein BN1205_092390 [Toxoplasma gondii VEG]|eukprot:XP_018637674.1 hypothetical protein TGME49_239120 [Toxoplasma gondii ME49]
MSLFNLGMSLFNEPVQPPSVYTNKGEIRQCNQGRYRFSLDQSSEPDKIILELEAPKYLCTSAIDVDVHPSYVRCTIKNKVTQLRLPAEVRVEESRVQRSKATGHLRIEMPLVEPPPCAVRRKKIVAASPVSERDEEKRQEANKRGPAHPTKTSAANSVPIKEMLNVTGKAKQFMPETSSRTFSAKTELRKILERKPGGITAGGGGQCEVPQRTAAGDLEADGFLKGKENLAEAENSGRAEEDRFADDDALPELELVY